LHRSPLMHPTVKARVRAAGKRRPTRRKTKATTEPFSFRLAYSQQTLLPVWAWHAGVNTFLLRCASTLIGQRSFLSSLSTALSNWDNASRSSTAPYLPATELLQKTITTRTISTCTSRFVPDGPWSDVGCSESRSTTQRHIFSTPETHRRQRRLPEKARIPNVGLVHKSRLAILMWHHCAVLGEQHRNARLGLNYTLLFDSRDGRC
jgi:hypothetical protein